MPIERMGSVEQLMSGYIGGSPKSITLGNGTIVVAWSDWNGSSSVVKGLLLDPEMNVLRELDLGTQNVGSNLGFNITALEGSGFAIALETWNPAAEARVFDLAGNQIGNPSTIVPGSRAYGNQSPAILALEGGAYIVAVSANVGNGMQIYVRKFDATGQALTEPILVETAEDGHKLQPSLGFTGDGDIVVSWGAWNNGALASARILDGNLEILGDEFPLDNDTARIADWSTTLPLSGDGFATVYRSSSSTESRTELTLHDGEGNLIGAPVLIGDMPGRSTNTASAISLSDGGFAVAWLSMTYPATSAWSYVQLFDAHGASRTEPLQISTNAGFTPAQLTELADGRIVASYSTPYYDGRAVIRAIDPDGHFIGDPFYVDVSKSAGGTQLATIIPLDGGKFMATWPDGSGGMEGSLFDITPGSYAPSQDVDYYTIPEHGILTVTASDLLADDIDRDGETVSFVSLGDEVYGGSVQIDAQGNITFTPDEGVTDGYFTYITTDGILSTKNYVGVAIEPINDPVVASDDFSTSVAENIAPTTILASATASDPDQGDTLSFSIVSGNEAGLFSIDGAGNIRLADGKTLDRETAASHVLTVEVSDAAGTRDVQVITIDVEDVDEFDVGPVSDIDGAPGATVAENLAVGSAVGITSRASDADATTNGITYSLDQNGGGKFAIDAATGVVSLAQALDFETSASHSIIVRATSADGSASTAAFTITVTDVQEGPPALPGATNGADRLQGDDGNDAGTLLGGNDVYEGRGGSDVIDGGDGNDVIHGDYSSLLALLLRYGNDTLSGGAGNDQLFGGNGNDILSGGTGNDILSGGLGADVIEGGAGADVLSGGLGADRFVFRAGDTGNTAATRDEIFDFLRTDGDRIDLSSIDARPATAQDDAFTFFTNAAQALATIGAVYVERTGLLSQRIHINTSSAAGSEMQIDVDLALALRASDFIL